MSGGTAPSTSYLSGAHVCERQAKETGLVDELQPQRNRALREQGDTDVVLEAIEQVVETDTAAADGDAAGEDGLAAHLHLQPIAPKDLKLQNLVPPRIRCLFPDTCALGLGRVAIQSNDLEAAEGVDADRRRATPRRWTFSCWEI